jgi:cytoskeletal protein CcmA (bactofilin family)
MSAPERPLAALLGRGATYTGEMSFEGRVRVDGTYRGRIYTDDTLEIGESGTVDGDIDAAVLIVAGTASGGIHVRERLVLQPTGTLRGTVDAKSLEAHPGATVDATVRVGG